MGIMIDGTILSSRGTGLNNIINGYINKKQQTLQSLYEQQAAIEDMYNAVASGLYTAQSSIYQLNSYYNNQIASKNASINNLQTQIKLADNKISALNSMHSSFKTTVTSLDEFLASVRASSNASHNYDFNNTNTNALEVSIINTDNLVTQRVDYNVKQVATSTRVTSYTFNGYNLSERTAVKDIFAGTYDSAILTGTRGDLSEGMTMKQLGVTSGYWEIGITKIFVGENDSLKDIADMLKADGYNAGVKNGQFFIDGRNIKDMNIHDQRSNLGEVLGLTVSTGDFCINGKRIEIDDEMSIQGLVNTINNDPEYGVGALFENNQLTLVAKKTGNVLIEIDKGTSSFTNVAGFTVGGKMLTDNIVLGSDGSKLFISGSNSISSVSGNVSSGQFVLSKTYNGTTSKAIINVAQGANLQATLNNVISQINASSLNLTASIENDRFVIRNNDLGTGYEITVESGESDFTEKLGFTNPVLSAGLPDFDETTNYFTTLTGITDISSITTANTVTAGSFKINGTTINLSAGTLQSAMNTINSYKNTTGVIAEYVGGHMVLRNEFTGSQNLYVEGGTSNFGEISGFTTQSVNTASATYGQVGSKSTLTGAETVSSSLVVGASVLNINGTTVRINGGALSSVVTQLNNDYSSALNLTFGISSENKFVITENRNGELPISVSSESGNFAELTGIAGYQTVVGQEEKYGSSKTIFTATRNVSNNTQILDSVVNLNGQQISLSGNIADAILTINSRTSLTGVEAYIDGNNKFCLRNSTAGSSSIAFNVLSGDFGRVVGTGTYSTTTGSSSHTDKVLATVTGANTGLNEFSQVLAGSKIQFGTQIIDLGASVGAALLAINSNKDATGVEAYLNNNGQFVLKAVNDEMANVSFSVIGSGDFGRVTGLGSYTVGAAASNGSIVNAVYSTLTGSNNVANTTEITATSITLTFDYGSGSSVSKTFELADGTLESAMKTINDANWYVKAEIVNNKLQFVSRSAGPFTIGLSINSQDGVTGDFGRVVGMAKNVTSAGTQYRTIKDPATYTGATSNLQATDELIGTNTIKLWMSRTLSGTGTNTEGGTGSLASVAQTVTFVDKDGDGQISLQDAIDSINDVKSTTKIEASLVNGRFTLTQIDANTAGEGDTINFELSGDGDFARVAGYGSYTALGQSNTGNVVGQSFTTLVGARSVTATNEVLASTFTLSLTKGDSANAPAVNLSTTINVADGTLSSAVSSINTQLAAAGIAVTASVTDGKLQFKSDIAGDYNIAVNMDNSDIGRVSGIGTYTTADGTIKSVDKVAAKVTGGNTGLTRNSQIIGNVQLTLQGVVTRTTTGVNTEGGTNNALSSVRTINLSGTIGDAIDAINAQTSSTQIRAYLDAQGRFILEQTNQNTASEFDTISFSLAGTGDFGAVTGLGAYNTYGQNGNNGTTSGQSNSTLAGVVENLKGTEQITAGTVTIKITDDVSNWSAPVERTLNVNVSGTVEQAVAQINQAAANAGFAAQAYIDETNGRFTIKSTTYGQDAINVTVQNSDFGRVTGIANYRMDYATVTSATSTYDLHPVLVGNNDVNGDMVVLNGTLVIEDRTINTVNKTLDQISQEVNNLGIAGVTAGVEDGHFQIKMLESAVGSPVSVMSTGDFARLTGLGSYSVGSATFVKGSYERTDGTPSYVTKSAMGLPSTGKFVSGSITIEHSDGMGGTSSFTINTKDMTIDDVVREINRQGQSGHSVDSEDGYSLNFVYAEFKDGEISIRTNENSHTVTATGDFARVTGFSEFRAGSAQSTDASTTEELGTFKYTSKNSTVLSATTTFSDGSIFVRFDNGANGTKEISVDATGKTLAYVVEKLQQQADILDNGETSIDGYNTSRPTITFDSSTGKISVVTYGETHDVWATGNVAMLTGFEENGDYSFTAEPTKPIVTYQKDGVLTGGTNINDVTSGSNGKALIGQAGTIDFYNGRNKIGSITVSETDTLQQVLGKINSMAVNNPAPTDVSNVNYDESISARIVDGHIQLTYGAGMQSGDLTVSGTSSFVYYYGLGSSDTTLSQRSTTYNYSNKDVYRYTNGSITGSVDVKTMLSTGSLTVEGTEIAAFCGQKDGVFSFVSVDEETGRSVIIGNVEIKATDSLDEVMHKINNMKTVDAITPDGVYINKINGFTASFTAEGKIQITYGGQQGDVRIQDSSGFAQYYGLTDSVGDWAMNSSYEQAERPYPDRVGQSVVTGSTIGYNDSTVVGGLQSGVMSVSLNGKTINVSYTNTESLSVILGRMVETANQADGSGLFDYFGDLDHNISTIADDKLSYSINANGQIVLSGGVELRTEDKLVITDLSGNFARLTGIATMPEGFVGETGTVSAPSTPGINVDGTKYYVTPYSQTGSHGTFSFAGASVNGLSGSTVLSGLKNGGFNIETTAGNKWISVSSTDSVNDILAKINALDAGIKATFDEANNRVKITATGNTLNKISITGDTSGFAQRAGLNGGDGVIAANYTNEQQSLGRSKIWSSVGNLHESHVLGNIQGGVNSATETVTLTDGVGSVNITIADDESFSSIIQKIKNTNKFDAGITDGKMWIKSLADSTQEITVSDSNFARAVGFDAGTETMGSGILTVGNYGSLTYTGAVVLGLLGSSNLTIDQSLAGAGDGSIRITLSDKTSNTVNVATKTFDVSITKDMTVNDIMTAIKTAAVNAGVSGFEISFDNSTHQVRASVSGNQAEKITFTGNDAKGTELVKRLGLALSDNVMVNNGTNVKESAGYTTFTGSVSGLHGGHVLGNLKTETFSISGPNGSVNVNITSGQTLSQIIASIGTQTGGRYTAGIDANGRFFIRSAVQSATAITVSSTDFTRRVGLVATNSNEGASSQTVTGSHGKFEFYGAGGTGNTGVDGMKGTTIFTGLRNGSFNFTLGATSISTPTGQYVYHNERTFSVSVSSSDTVQSILNKMKDAIVAAGGYSNSDINFSVEVDDTTNKGRIHLLMNGKDASQITFSNDNTGFVTMAGLSNTGATTNANYTAVARSYGKAGLTGSVDNLKATHVFGNMQAGTMVIQAGSITKTINIAATDTIQTVANKIKDGGLFNAGLDENGRFFVRTNSDTNSNVSVSGTSDFYKLVGMQSASWTYNATNTEGSFGYSKITGSVKNLTANQKFNNMTSGNFTISAAGMRTLTVAVNAGSTKVSDVINYINSTATSDYHAELNSDGQLVINTKVSNGATIIVRDGTSNYAQIMGLTNGTISNSSLYASGVSDKYSTLTGATTGLDSGSKFSSGDFTISVKSPTGSVAQKTFTLTGNESLSQIATTITASSVGVTASLDAVTGQLILTSKAIGAYEISVTDGTTNFAEATGLTKNHSQIQEAQKGTLAVLTSSKNAQNANLLGYTSGTFFVSLTDKLGNVTSTEKITIEEGDTVQRIAEKITSSSAGVNAQVDATTGRLVLTRKSSVDEGGIKVTKGTSDFTNKIGLTQGGEQSAAVKVTNGTDATNTVLNGAVLSSVNLSTKLGELGIEDGTLIINNKVIEVSLNDNIQQLINKINSAFTPSDSSAVTAELKNNRIVLTTNAKSDNARINVETGSSNAANVLGFTNGATLNTAAQSVGLQSKITINGVDYTSMINDFALDKDCNVVDPETAEEAIRLTLKELGNGSIDIGKGSVEETTLKLMAFANSFNSSMMLAQNAALASDTGFQSLLATLRSAIIDNIGDNTKVEKALSNIGISLYSTLMPTGNTRLAMVINKEKFETAMVTDTSVVLNLLVGNDEEPLEYTEAGSFVRLKSAMEDTLKPVSGYFKSNARVIDAQKRALQKELTGAKGELAQLEAELANATRDNEAVKQKEELEAFLEDITEQYKTITALIERLNKQYTQSLNVLAINKTNPSFN